jgi:hypothetical protein
MFGWFEARRTVKTPTYSVELRKQTRELLLVIYREGCRESHFRGEFSGKKWEQVNLSVPPDVTDEELPRFVKNLSEALTTLRYEFVITRPGASEPITEAELQAALAELRELGLDADVSTDRFRVQLKKLAGWKRPVTFNKKEYSRRLVKAAATVRGKRSPNEVVAKSPSAEVLFFS